MSITESELPLKKSGRTVELNDAYVSQIAARIKAKPVTDSGRPNAVGPDDTFDTKGKATNTGGHYQKAVHKALGLKDDQPLRLNAYEASKGKWKWRLYLPLPEKKKKEAETEQTTAPAK